MRDNNSLDEYGFSLGGPVRIPKIYNGRTVPSSSSPGSTTSRIFCFRRTTFRLCRPLAQRNGDFSQTFNAQGQLMPVYDPVHRPHW